MKDMKKTMVFENETAYDNWFDVNEEKEGGHDFLENRVVIIKATATDPETAESEEATEKELEKVEKELIEPEDSHIEDIKKFKEKTELNENYDVITDERFHQLTKTLIKSLFKAIGTDETRKIHFIISNNMVFFNYNGIQYKYYPSQCKIFKQRERKYQRINWKNFGEENNPEGQKQNRGRSPPFLLLI